MAAIAAVGILILGVVKYIAPNNPPVFVTETEQVNTDDETIALTATIDSYRYEHAQHDTNGEIDSWRTEWVDAIDSLLKRQEKPEEFRAAVAKAMDDLVAEKLQFWSIIGNHGVGQANRWYSVTIRNDGSVPLKDVFLRIAGTVYWVEKESGLLTYAYSPLAFGELPQKETIRLTLWVRTGSFRDPPEILLGHANGLGVVTLNRH